MTTYYRLDGWIQSQTGACIPNGAVAVLTQPATTSAQPGSPLATTYADNAGADPITNPLTADSLGHYECYVAEGLYTLQLYGAGIIGQIVLTDQLVNAPAGSGTGTVTSVALTTPTYLTVAGSPITTSGTLAVSGTTGLTQNEVLATPNGSSGALSVRSLVAADIPAIPLTSGVSGILPVANGGSGSASPALVSGSNVTITGSWPNQTIAASGTISSVPTFTSTNNYTPDQSSTAFATKGVVVTALQAITVYRLIANVYGNSGDVYAGSILNVTGGTTISSVLATTNSYTFGSTITGVIIFTFGSPPTLTAGNQYGIFIGIISGTGTTPAVIDTTTGSLDFYCPGLTPTTTYARIAAVSPSSGTLTTGAGQYLITVVGSL